jgi:hypothetical protein
VHLDQVHRFQLFQVGGLIEDNFERLALMSRSPMQVDCFLKVKDHPEGRIDPEEAKHVAKRVVEALSGARLRIVPISDN